jgi:hypothetical protein
VRVLRPGQTVTLHVQNTEPFDRIEGRIQDVTIYDDMSAQYEVRWWVDGEPVTGVFSVSEIEEPDDAKYIEIGEV